MVVPFSTDVLFEILLVQRFGALSVCIMEHARVVSSLLGCDDFVDLSVIDGLVVRFISEFFVHFWVQIVAVIWRAPMYEL